MIVLKNILVATDFSEPAAVAMAYGRDLARTYQARLHVVHIVEDVLAHYSPEIGLVSEQLQKDLEEVAWRDLDRLVTDDDRRTISIDANVKTSFTSLPASSSTRRRTRSI
jgi:nucleotide-binding universal stress UspA family protein